MISEFEGKTAFCAVFWGAPEDVPQKVDPPKMGKDQKSLGGPIYFLAEVSKAGG